MKIIKALNGRNRFAASVSLAALGVACAAHAQTEPAAPKAPQASEIEEIVVTAQFRQQAAKDVPLALKAFSGETLERFDLRSWEDVASLTPGVLIQQQNDSSPSYVIRGIEAPTSDAASEPGVSIFVNGVDSSRTKGSLSELYDIDRVEIARGPQSTLYGRGAAVGAFSIHTRMAELNQSSAQFEGEVGNYKAYSATAIVNAPLVDDTLAARFAVRRREREGYMENLADPGHKLNDDDLWAARLSLRWRPVQDLTFDLVAGYQRDQDGDTAAKAIALASPGGDTSPFSAAAQNPMENRFDREVSTVTLLGELKRGDWTINSITGWRKIDFDNGWDPDGTSYQFLYGREDQREESASQELRFAFDNGGKLRAQFGGNLFRDVVRDGLTLGANEQYLVGGFPARLTPVPAIPIGGGVVLPVSQRIDSLKKIGSKRVSMALYGNLSLDVTPRLTVELGARQAWDDADLSASAGVISRDGRAPIAIPNGLLGNSRGQTFTTSDDFSYFTPRLAAVYRLTPAVNLYGSVAKGVRGGYPQINITNPTATTVLATPSPVKAETIWSYELGAKGRAPITGGSFDVAAFYYDYTNFQTLSLDITKGTVNAGAAKAWGVEASYDQRLTDTLRVFAGYNFLHTEYEDFRDKVGGVIYDLSGNRFRLAPENTFSVGADYTQPISDKLEAYLRGTYAHRSGYFFNSDNLPSEQQKAFGLLNLRAGLAAPGGRWAVEAYGTNLLDTDWVRDMGNAGKSFGVPTAIRADPRFVGLRLTVRR
jgi:outer membrane receptor protein involved in Fe transport